MSTMYNHASEVPKVAMTTLVRRLLELADGLRNASRRLAADPGIGVITATAIVATASELGRFRSGRGSLPCSVSSPIRTRAVTDSVSASSQSREIAIFAACFSLAPRP
jgi:transposase